MPFVLHPSGYCVWYNDKSKGNLITGERCPLCGRTAGHHYDCIYFKEKQVTGSSRPKLYNAISVLRQISTADMYFYTFTLPSRPGEKTYQISPHCRDTGDLVVTATFSKLLEAVAARIKRSSRPNEEKKFSYVWIAEAQMKRQAKFGGIGDLHFHLVTNQRIDITWLQSTWSAYFSTPENRHSVHAEPIPRAINSIPAYLAKYLGKGSPRRIYSRRYSSSQDLSAFRPITLRTLPSDLQPIRTKILPQASGYEVTVSYFNTEAVLKRYGRIMREEHEFQVTRSGQNFTPSAINSRKFKREIVENQRRYAAKVGLIPGL